MFVFSLDPRADLVIDLRSSVSTSMCETTCGRRCVFVCVKVVSGCSLLTRRLLRASFRSLLSKSSQSWLIFTTAGSERLISSKPVTFGPSFWNSVMFRSMKPFNTTHVHVNSSQLLVLCCTLLPRHRQTHQIGQDVMVVLQVSPLSRDLSGREVRVNDVLITFL